MIARKKELKMAPGGRSSHGTWLWRRKRLMIMARNNGRGWPEGDKKEILSRLWASDCCWTGKTVAATQLGRYSLHCCGQRCHKLWEWGLCGDRVLFIKGWFGGAPKLRGFESDTVSHFDKLITEQDHAASGRWVHQRPGGQAWESELFQVVYQRHRHSEHLIWHVERQREREYTMQIANWKFFKATLNQFWPGFRVLPIGWDQVTAACLLSVKTCPPA